MFFSHVFVLCFLLSGSVWTNVISRKKSFSDPCNDRKIILETVLFNNTLENKFRLGMTSTLFIILGGSSSVTWNAKKPLVSDVWTEFFFFYEQGIVLRFFQILLGFEPSVMSLTCIFDTASRQHSFFFRIENKLFGTCRNNKLSYVCSVGMMKEFFMYLERYKGGTSIIMELKKHAKNIQNKWSDICKKFNKLEKDATHTYVLHYNYTMDTISCSVKSSVPWRYEIAINGSVINDTKTTYDRETNIHTTSGSVSRGGGVYFLCTIHFPYGKKISKTLDISTFIIPTTLISTISTSTLEEYLDSPTVANIHTITEIQTESVKKISFQNDVPIFGAGSVTFLVIIVLLVIGLIASFVFQKEITSFRYKFQNVPTESPYKDIVMTIGG